MAKRFHDTDRWTEWYRNLPLEYRGFWDFINDKCDLVGVWIVDMPAAQFNVGRELNKIRALTLFGPSIRALSESLWYLPEFVPFQYKDLSGNNNFHRSLRAALLHYGISAPDQGQTSPRPGADQPQKPLYIYKDVKDVKVKDVAVRQVFNFEEIWNRYPRKLGRKEAERHFRASIKTPQAWADLQNALDNYIAQIRREHIEPEYVMHGSTWFNNWQDYVNYRGVVVPPAPKLPPKAPEPPPPELTPGEIAEMHETTVKNLGPRYAQKTEADKNAG